MNFVLNLVKHRINANNRITKKKDTMMLIQDIHVKRKKKSI